MRYIFLIIICVSSFSGASQNLITNPSFEDSLGNFSLNGWYQWGNPIDTLYFDSSANVPAGGGNWSARLATDFPQTHHLAWFVTGMQGTNVYQLSVWAEKTGPWYMQWPPIIIAMGIIDTGYYNYPSFAGASPSFEGVIFDLIPFSWDNVTLVDTLTTQATDSIAVILMGGTTFNGPDDFVYYDLAELTVLDTSTSTLNSKTIQTQLITVYPNPSNDHTTIKFNNKKQDNVQLALFTITGKVIRQIETTEEQLIIEKGKLSSGIYFYRLINHNNGKLLGRGKLVLQ